MRHGIAGNRLGRHSSWRKATIRDLAKATLIHQRICTTEAKAKEARKLVDHLITLAKKGTLAHRRRAFAILCNHQMVSDLFKDTAPRFKDRQGGYTRIIPLASLRKGDNAQLAYLELTEKKEVIVSKPKTSVAKKKTAPSEAEKEIRAEKGPHVVAEETKEEKAKSPLHPAPQKLVKQEKDTTKPSKQVMGGIKKIFRRKVGE